MFCIDCFTYATIPQVSGTDLMYNGQKVFLSGANAAWNDYGNDFGNGHYTGILETWMADIGASGGNSFSKLQSTINFDYLMLESNVDFNSG